MKNQIEEAVTLFERGFSCSQAILAVYGESFAIPRDLAFRIACPFGAGMARRGEICGALTGAMMVIGLKYGMDKADNQSTKDKTYARVHDFLSLFQMRNHSILCRDLLGVDISTPEGLQRNREEKLSMQKCPKLIRDAAEILEGLI